MKKNQIKTPKEILYEQYSDLFDFARSIVERKPGIFHGQKCNSLARRITLFHSVRAICLLRSINLLCQEGYAAESKILLRSLLNLLINIKWLTSGDSRKRMNRYAEFDAVYEKIYLEASIRYGRPVDEDLKRRLSELNIENMRVRKQYGIGANDNHFTWSGKSIRNMSIQVGLVRHYDLVYNYLSAIEHTSSNTTREYFDVEQNGDISMYSGPRKRDIDLVLISALSYYLSVKEIACSLFELDRGDLEKENMKLVELTIKYWFKKEI